MPVTKGAKQGMKVLTKMRLPHTSAQTRSLSQSERRAEQASVDIAKMGNVQHCCMPIVAAAWWRLWSHGIDEQE